MIDEIFDEYEKQQKENFLMIGKHFGIEGEFLSRPNANHDLIIILKSTNLLNEEIDSRLIAADFGFSLNLRRNSLNLFCMSRGRLIMLSQQDSSRKSLIL